MGGDSAEPELQTRNALVPVQYGGILLNLSKCISTVASLLYYLEPLQTLYLSTVSRQDVFACLPVVY